MNNLTKAFGFLAFWLLAATTRADTLFVTDNSAGTVSQITADGKVRVFASGLVHPTFITYCDGNLYVACANATINRISGTGAVSVLATNVGTNFITGVVGDGQGNIFALEGQTGIIFKISNGGVVSPLASANPASGGSGEPLEGLVMDKDGNMFTTEISLSHTGPDGEIRKVTSTGIVSVFAPNLPSPRSLVLDHKGNLIVGNMGHDTLSTITPAGVVITYPSGLNGRPNTLAMDSQDNLYAGCNNLNGDFIYKVTPAGVVSIFAKMSGLTQMALMPTPSTRESNTATVPPPAPQINSVVIFLASPAIILVVVLMLWLVLRKKTAAQ